MSELKNLKTKFIAIMMILLTVTTTTIFSGIWLVMQRTGSQQALRQMEALALRDTLSPRKAPLHPENTGRFSPDFMIFRNSFSVKLNEAGYLISFNHGEEVFSSNDFPDMTANLDETEQEMLQGAITTLLTRSQDNGSLMINNNPYRYLMMDKPYGSIVVFLDKSMELEILKRLTASLITIGLAGLVPLFLASLVLAERVIRPARKAWEHQKRFIADASHELKTPLTIIAANTDVVLSNPDARVSTQEKWLHYIQMETDRMSGLVNDMLVIAKIDASEQKLQVTSFNLSDTILDTILPLESLAFECGRHLLTDIPANIQWTGDASSVRRVMGILLDNALKHISGSGDIQISVAKEDLSGRIHIQVSNPGDSIPPEERERIFERFYRLDSSRTRDTGGYGLGLSIAKSIVEESGGTLTVHTDVDGMITFTMSLPADKSMEVSKKKGRKRFS